MTATTKPAYLEPTDSVQVQPQCAYEPPLSVGTQIRMGEPRSLEERTLRYEHCRTGEPMELVADNPAAFEIAGFQDVEHWTMDRESNEFKYDGSRRCAYAVTGEEKPYDPEEHLQEVLKGEAFQAVCERDKVKDPEAHLRANRLQWLCPSNTWSGRKYFTLGAGEFHSALIGGEWIPCVREQVRTQTQPVLGWSVSKRQSAFRPRSGTENGHKGIVRKQGKYARESTIERRRWTTTLSIEALEVLDRMSSEMGLHRNEVVEQLVARADALLGTGQPQKAAPVADGDDELKRRKRLTKAEATQLDQELLELIRNGGATNDDLQRLADAKGQKLSSIRNRFRGLEKVEAQRHYRHANTGPSSTYD